MSDTAGADYILNVENLQFAHGRRPILCGVSFALESGSVMGLLGPNGAGKTTCIRLLAGLLEASSGRILFDGKDISRWSTARRVKSGLAWLPQEPSVFSRLDVRGNLKLFCEESGLSRRQTETAIERVTEQFGLAGFEGRRAELLSGGERRRLELARAMLASPRCLLLDEPFTAIDPLAVELMQKHIAALAASGMAILISDHNVRETLRICRHAVIIESGSVMAAGTPEKLAADETARRMYLGENFRLD